MTRIIAHEDDYCDKINVYIQVYDKPHRLALIIASVAQFNSNTLYLGLTFHLHFEVDQF